jgi:mannose-6-phosphate isomerase-like protein (cupin superfamily)
MAEARSFVVEINDHKDYQRLVEPGRQSLGLKAGRVHLECGQACGEHSTGAREEVLVFLAGHGELLTGADQKAGVGQGQVAYIPPQTLHNVINTGAEPLVYVFCVTPVSGHGGAARASDPHHEHHHQD